VLPDDFTYIVLVWLLVLSSGVLVFANVLYILEPSVMHSPIFTTRS